MTRTSDLVERLAARMADGERIDWSQEEAACGSEEERAFVRNLKIVTDISTESDVRGLEEQAPSPAADSSPQPDGAGGEGGRLRDAEILMPGTIWGPLEILGLIGRGGFGQVYRARDTRLDRLVALKILHLSDRIQEERALADGRLMARVRHPNVVTVHGAERIGERVGIWMDHLDGRTLEEILEHEGPLGARDAAGIGIEICGALAAVHNAGLVHGDLKAQNVMKERGGRIVLMDFGAAQDAGSGPPGARVSGTPFYLPPEVFEGGAMTGAGDIYALGVLLYRLVTRSFPVRAENLEGLREAHARGEMTLLRDARPDLAGEFVRVIEKALSRDPAGRFDTPGRMQAALEHSLSTARPGGEPPAPAPSLRRRPGRRLYLAVGAGAVLAAAGGLWIRLSPPPDLPTQVEGTAPSELDYTISAGLYRSEEGGRELLVPGARIGIGDRLHMDFEASEPVHVYVLNRDLAGNTFILFPRPDCDLANPLAPGLHRLPGRRASDGTPLDWQVDSAGGREQILIVASLGPLDILESALASLPAGGRYAELSREATVRLRGIGGVAERPAGAAPPDAASLFDDVKRLAGTKERASGTWMRQIDLENPPAQ